MSPQPDTLAACARLSARLQAKREERSRWQSSWTAQQQVLKEQLAELEAQWANRLAHCGEAAQGEAVPAASGGERQPQSTSGTGGSLAASMPSSPIAAEGVRKQWDVLSRVAEAADAPVPAVPAAMEVAAATEAAGAAAETAEVVKMAEDSVSNVAVGNASLQSVDGRQQHLGYYLHEEEAAAAYRAAAAAKARGEDPL